MLDLTKCYEYFQPEKAERIHIIGCGSVGATIAEQLVRMGITKLTLWDMDTVCPHNLTNQIFRYKDIGKPKVEALLDILTDINPDVPETIKLCGDGWDGQRLSGVVFLAVDSIEIRRRIVEQHMNNLDIAAMFDVRTALEGAQHYAADWLVAKQKKSFLDTMQFGDDEAAEETPVSACGVTLGVNPTVRAICAIAVANYVNFKRGKSLKNMVVFDVFDMSILSF